MQAEPELVLRDPESLFYVPYALAGMLFGWGVEDVDRLGVGEFKRILEVGLALWRETNLISVLGKALKGLRGL
ncbi:MAG: hypothetical protein QXI60_08495 [Thermofilaceae archaeon]